MLSEIQIEPALIEIPASDFRMGSETGQDCERPVHRVWIDAFEMAATQVTNAEYAKFLAATGHRKPLHWDDPNFSHPEQPVVAPSWFDAIAYCEWLSALTKKRYRLPTEAEWERATRGGAEQKLFPWGDEPLESLANWLTRNNVQFSRNLANRVWFHLLGRGIVDPVDDFRESNPPSNPALMAAITAHFEASGMRLKPLVAWIMKSRITR